MSKVYPGIYKIVCQVTGDFYVGSSAYVYSRKSDHFLRLRKNTHVNIHLQRAFNKYGEETFVFEILERPLIDRLIEREQYWIDTLAPAYNIRKIAESNLGLKKSIESREKQRQWWRSLSPEEKAQARQVLEDGRRKQLADIASGEYVHSPETIEAIKIARAKQETTLAMLEALKQGQEIRKQVMPKPRLGMTNTDEHNQKIAEAHLGMKATEEAKQKMREQKLGKKQSPEHIKKRVEGRREHVVSEEQRRQFGERSREMWAKRTPEERRAIIQKRPPVSEETRAKQRAAKLGRSPKPLSDEANKRKAEARKATIAKRKAAQAENQSINQQPLF